MNAEPPRLKHNHELAEAYIASSGIVSRYPPVNEQVECLPLDTTELPAFVYNPSILRIGGKLWMTYRYHFAGDPRTKLGICQIVDGVATSPNDLPIDGMSVEDARLFSFHAEMWASWVESDFVGQRNPHCVVKHAQIESPEKVGRIYQTNAGTNYGNSMEKNWCFFESDENLFSVYCPMPEHTVLQIQGPTIINEYKTAPVRWPYGTIRGGCIVPYEDKLLRFFHSRTEFGIGKPEHRYYVGALLMERRPPFTVLSVGRKPILYGSELPVADVFHFKPNVVFPTGAIVDGDGWILALGVNDSGIALAKIKPEMLNL